MRISLELLVAILFSAALALAQTRAGKTLDIYVLDMDGDSASLFVSPAGESVLIDTGNTGAVLTITERQAPTEQDYVAKKDQIRDSSLQQQQAEVFNLFLGNLRESMQKSGKIKINEKELATLTKARTEENE